MTTGEQRSIQVNGRAITFELKRSERSTLSISVEPDSRVVIIAPREAPVGLVEAKVKRRATWIRRQQSHFEALPPPLPRRQWVSGETHRYLGRQYRLKVMTATKASVRLSGGFFIVTVPDKSDGQAVEAAMRTWYRDHARPLFQDRMAKLLAASTWLKLSSPPQLTVRRMRLRWGSTKGQARLCLNEDLVKMPLGCIDYVIVHELAHLRVPNHGAPFWRLLSRLYPEWEKWRERLQKQEVDLA